MNQGKSVSADSKSQGPVRILREGVGIKCGFRVSIDLFFWLIVFSEFNPPPLCFDPPSIDTMLPNMSKISGHHDVSDVCSAQA